MKSFIAVSLSIDGEPLVYFDEKRLKRLYWSYLHGELEEVAGYDIYMFVDKIPKKEGIYDVNVLYPDKQIESTLFLWESNVGSKGLQGLLVSKNDKDSFEDARNKYESKQYCI